MRVIAGSARGTRLRVLDAPGLRPTGDRQRETLFNVIRDVVPGARVLDAFAGTGALGLEALSRGAESAVFVERDRRVGAALRENVERCRMEDVSKVLLQDIRAALRRLQRDGVHFDLLLADPPWADDSTAEWLRALGAVAGPGALLCFEQQKGVKIPVDPCWEPRRELLVGDTAIHLLTRLVPSDRDC